MKATIRAKLFFITERVFAVLTKFNSDLDETQKRRLQNAVDIINGVAEEL